MENLSKFIDNSYKQKLIDQLNIEPYLAKMVREESERTEKMLQEVIPPFRAWLAKKLKWRWILRTYHIQESQESDKRVYRVFKGKTMLREFAFDKSPTISFRRF
jgi:hypothetical protein